MLYITSDHAGFELKNTLLEQLSLAQIEVQDLAKQYDEHDDYPDRAQTLSDFLLADTARGVLSQGVAICRSGQGICMALNRFKWIRAGLGDKVEGVIMMKEDNNANVLCLGADFIQNDDALNLVQLFLTTPFTEAERHVRRIQKLDKLG